MGTYVGENTCEHMDVYSRWHKLYRLAVSYFSMRPNNKVFAARFARGNPCCTEIRVLSLPRIVPLQRGFVSFPMHTALSLTLCFSFSLGGFSGCATNVALPRDPQSFVPSPRTAFSRASKFALITNFKIFSRSFRYKPYFISRARVNVIATKSTMISSSTRTLYVWPQKPPFFGSCERLVTDENNKNYYVHREQGLETRNTERTIRVWHEGLRSSQKQNFSKNWDSRGYTWETRHSSLKQSED